MALMFRCTFTVETNQIVTLLRSWWDARNHSQNTDHPTHQRQSHTWVGGARDDRYLTVTSLPHLVQSPLLQTRRNSEREREKERREREGERSTITQTSFDNRINNLSQGGRLYVALQVYIHTNFAASLSSVAIEKVPSQI